jgi:hypothetical protein
MQNKTKKSSKTKSAVINTEDPTPVEQIKDMIRTCMRLRGSQGLAPYAGTTEDLASKMPGYGELRDYEYALKELNKAGEIIFGYDKVDGKNVKYWVLRAPSTLSRGTPSRTQDIRHTEPATKSLGQVAFEARPIRTETWDTLPEDLKRIWQAIGQAVAAHVHTTDARILVGKKHEEFLGKLLEFMQEYFKRNPRNIPWTGTSEDLQAYFAQHIGKPLDMDQEDIDKAFANIISKSFGRLGKKAGVLMWTAQRDGKGPVWQIYQKIYSA